MIYLFMAIFVSVGWSHNETQQHATQTRHAQQHAPVEATIQQLVEGIIADQSIDIANTTVSMKSNSSSHFQMKGAAGSNAHIADLIEALTAESQTSKVYLVSTEKSAIDGKPRRVFVMTAAYTASQ